jgi:hypothetical protein
MRAHVVQICERNGIEINYGDTQVQMASSARFGFSRLDRPAHMRLWGGDVVLYRGQLGSDPPGMTWSWSPPVAMLYSMVGSRIRSPEPAIFAPV